MSDVAPLVALDLGRQPLGVRDGADQHEEAAGGDRPRLAGRAVAERQALEPASPRAADDLGLRHARRCCGAASISSDQVLRHALRERLAAHEDRHAPRVAGRCIAAWPAELPPPTTKTSCPASACASPTEAP